MITIAFNVYLVSDFNFFFFFLFSDAQLEKEKNKLKKILMKPVDRSLFIGPAGRIINFNNVYIPQCATIV